MSDNFKSYTSSVLSGLKDNSHDLQRQLCAVANHAYYLGNFRPYAYTVPVNRAADGRSTRYCLLTRLIVDKLTENLYRQSPGRVIADQPELTSWLETTYKQNSMFAKWLAADRLSMLNQLAAFQVGYDPTDAKRPIKIALWDASQLIVWTDPDDCTVPVVVLTSYVDGKQTKYKLTSATRIAEFFGETANLSKIQQTAEYANPYGLLPFSFVHFNFPTTDFWGGALGDVLRQANDNVNTLLTYCADDVRYNLRPKIVAVNCDPKMEANSPFLAGDILPVAEDVSQEGSASKESKLFYLQSNSEYVSKSWEDTSNYVNMTLEMCGIPESAVRMIQSKARSGVSIASEQIPLVNWSKSRQPFFAHYEEALAKLVLEVATASQPLGFNGLPNSELTDFELSLRWADMIHDVPGPGRNNEDEWLLRMGLTSKIQIMMRRNNIPRAEAVKALQALRVDQDEEEVINPGLSTVTDVVTAPGEGTAGDQIDPEIDDNSSNPGGDS